MLLLVAAPDDLNRRGPESAEVRVLASLGGGVVAEAGGEVPDARQDLAWLQQAVGPSAHAALCRTCRRRRQAGQASGFLSRPLRPGAMGGLLERADAAQVAEDVGGGDIPAVPVGGDDGEAVPPGLGDGRAWARLVMASSRSPTDRARSRSSIPEARGTRPATRSWRGRHWPPVNFSQRFRRARSTAAGSSTGAISWAITRNPAPDLPVPGALGGI